MNKVLITGANGFIAKKIAQRLKGEGLFVIGTSRNPSALPDYDEVVRGVLGEPLESLFRDHKIDAVVHCAYDKDEMDNISNAAGTLIWAEQAKENEVGLQIFLSSITADADSLSPYGRKKYEVEKWFTSHDQVVFRLGLVIGSGGMFGRIISTVKKSPAIPLIDRGETLMYPTDVDMLAEIVLDTVKGKNSIEKGRMWRLNQETPVPFIDMLSEIRKQFDLFCVFFSVPYFVVSLLLGLIEKLSFLKLGINANNIKWSRQEKDRKYESDLSALGHEDLSIEAMIKKLTD